MTTEKHRKLPILRQCHVAIDWLRDARGETVTSLWFLREIFDDPAETARNWTLVVELMDSTFNVLLRGNQLITSILHSLADLEGDDPIFRSILAEKVRRLEATGVRGVRTVRQFAEAVDPNFFRPGPRAARMPGSIRGAADGAPLRKAQEHIAELEALIDEEERQLVDMEGFLSLRGRDLEMGIAW